MTDNIPRSDDTGLLVSVIVGMIVMINHPIHPLVMDREEGTAMSARNVTIHPHQFSQCIYAALRLHAARNNRGWAVHISGPWCEHKNKVFLKHVLQAFFS